MQILNARNDNENLLDIETLILNHQKLLSDNEQYDVFSDMDMTVNSVDGVDIHDYTKYNVEPEPIIRVYVNDMSAAYYIVPSQFTDVLSINEDITLLDERPIITFNTNN